MKKPYKLFGLLLVVCLGLCYGVYRSTPRMIPTVVSNWLQGMGLEDVELEIGLPGLAQSNIRSLGFTVPVGGFYHRVSLEDVSLHYSLRGLFSKKIDFIEIHAARVSNTGMPVEQSGEVVAPNGTFRIPLPREVYRRLPQGVLKLINLSYCPGLKREALASVSGELEITDTGITFEGSAKPRSGDVRGVVGAVNTAGDVEGRVFRGEDETQALSGSFRVENSDTHVSIEGDIEADLGESQMILRDFLNIANLEAVSGSLQGAYTVRLPLDIPSEIQEMLNVIEVHLQPKLEITFPKELTGRQQIHLQADDTDLTVSEGGFKGSAAFQVFNGALSLVVQATHHFATGDGLLNFHTSALRFKPDASLRSYIGNSSLPFDLEQGTLSAIGQLQWPAESWDARSRLTLKGEDIAGYYKTIPFRGLTGTLPLRRITSVETRRLANVTLSEINPGLPLKDVHFSVRASNSVNRLPSKIEFEEVTAELFGGTLRCDSFVYDINNNAHELSLDIVGVSLADLIEAQKRNGLEASGTIDGVLPISFSAEGVQVTGGTLEARDAGKIRYTQTGGAGSLTQANAGFEIALEALKDFHYDTLTAGADYAPDGQLELKLHLAGRNPEFKNGQAIEFNINVEENIPKLLKSLRYADGIVTEYEKHLNRRR